MDAYKPPGVDLNKARRGAAPDFYVVSGKKMLIMFFATLGLYEVYWFYRNWELLKESDGSDIWPVARAVFAIFFAHSLFGRVDKALVGKGKDYRWAPTKVATTFVVASVLDNIMSRMAMQDVGSPLTDIISVLLLPVVVYTLFQAQHAVNTACDDPDGASNADLTPANYGWIAIGAVLWLFMLLGLFSDKAAA